LADKVKRQEAKPKSEMPGSIDKENNEVANIKRLKKNEA